MRYIVWCIYIDHNLDNPILHWNCLKFTQTLVVFHYQKIQKKKHALHQYILMCEWDWLYIDSKEVKIFHTNYSNLRKFWCSMKACLKHRVDIYSSNYSVADYIKVASGLYIYCSIVTIMLWSVSGPCLVKCSMCTVINQTAITLAYSYSRLHYYNISPSV